MSSAPFPYGFPPVQGFGFPQTTFRPPVIYPPSAFPYAPAATGFPSFAAPSPFSIALPPTYYPPVASAPIPMAGSIRPAEISVPEV